MFLSRCECCGYRTIWKRRVSDGELLWDNSHSSGADDYDWLPFIQRGGAYYAQQSDPIRVDSLGQYIPLTGETQGVIARYKDNGGSSDLEQYSSEPSGIAGDFRFGVALFARDPTPVFRRGIHRWDQTGYWATVRDGIALWDGNLNLDGVVEGLEFSGWISRNGGNRADIITTTKTEIINGHPSYNAFRFDESLSLVQEYATANTNPAYAMEFSNAGKLVTAGFEFLQEGGGSLTNMTVKVTGTDFSPGTSHTSEGEDLGLITRANERLTYDPNVFIRAFSDGQNALVRFSGTQSLPPDFDESRTTVRMMLVDLSSGQPTDGWTLYDSDTPEAYTLTNAPHYGEALGDHVYIAGQYSSGGVSYCRIEKWSTGGRVWFKDIERGFVRNMAYLSGTGDVIAVGEFKMGEWADTVRLAAADGSVVWSNDQAGTAVNLVVDYNEESVYIVGGAGLKDSNGDGIPDVEDDG